MISILVVALAISLLMLVWSVAFGGRPIDGSVIGLAGTIVTGIFALLHLPVKPNTVTPEPVVEVPNDTVATPTITINPEKKENTIEKKTDASLLNDVDAVTKSAD